jgi:hypothetical protein
MSKYTLLFVISSAFLLVQAFNCICPAKTTLQENYKSASMVFSGTVTEIRPIDDNIKVYFNVNKVWKGEPNTTKMTIITSNSPAACGFNFQIPQYYIVFASLDNTGAYTTTSCSMTQEFARELAILINAIPRS